MIDRVAILGDIVGRVILMIDVRTCDGKVIYMFIPIFAIVGCIYVSAITHNLFVYVEPILFTNAIVKYVFNYNMYL